MDTIVLLDSEDLNLINQIVGVEEATHHSLPNLSESDIKCVLRAFENPSPIPRFSQVNLYGQLNTNVTLTICDQGQTF